MRVIIMAAGRGKRMGRFTNDKPKCMLKAGGRVIIQIILDMLNELQVTDITIIIGYKGDVIRNYFNNKYKSLRISYIYNKNEKTNNCYSLWKAGNLLKQGFVLINSDTLFKQLILENLIITDKKKSYLAINYKDKFTKEQMKINEKDGLIVEISKNIPLNKTVGEFIGLSKFSEKDGKKLYEFLKEYVIIGDLSVYYEDIWQLMLPKLKLYSCSTGGERWFEIDTADDYNKAEKFFRIDRF